MCVKCIRTTTTTTRLNNIHPGEVLREEFVEPLEITPYRLAKAIGVQQTRLSEILKGKRSITPDTAIRLGPISWSRRNSG